MYCSTLVISFLVTQLYAGITHSIICTVLCLEYVPPKTCVYMNVVYIYQYIHIYIPLYCTNYRLEEVKDILCVVCVRVCVFVCVLTSVCIVLYLVTKLQTDVSIHIPGTVLYY